MKCKMFPRAAIQLHLRNCVLASITHTVVFVVVINREHCETDVVWVITQTYVEIRNGRKLKLADMTKTQQQDQQMCARIRKCVDVTHVCPEKYVNPRWHANCQRASSQSWKHRCFPELMKSWLLSDAWFSQGFYRGVTAHNSSVSLCTVKATSLFHCIWQKSVHFPGISDHLV